MAGTLLVRLARIRSVAVLLLLILATCPAAAWGVTLSSTGLYVAPGIASPIAASLGGGAASGTGAPFAQFLVNRGNEPPRPEWGQAFSGSGTVIAGAQTFADLSNHNPTSSRQIGTSGLWVSDAPDEPTDHARPSDPHLAITIPEPLTLLTAVTGTAAVGLATRRRTRSA